MGTDRFDLDPEGMRELAGRIIGLAERLTPGEQLTPGDPAMTGVGPPPLPTLDGEASGATLAWTGELNRVAHRLREVAEVMRRVATTTEAIDEELAARLARLGEG